MSYNPNPDWCKLIINIPDTCPECGKKLTLDMSWNEARYYEPRHIPPVIYGMCHNKECADWEQNVPIYLEAQVIGSFKEW